MQLHLLLLLLHYLYLKATAIISLSVKTIDVGFTVAVPERELMLKIMDY